MHTIPSRGALLRSSYVAAVVAASILLTTSHVMAAGVPMASAPQMAPRSAVASQIALVRCTRSYFDKCRRTAKQCYDKHKSSLAGVRRCSERKLSCDSRCR